MFRFLLLVLVFMSFGCAHLQEAAERERQARCSEAGAYEKGFNDGKAQSAMNSSVFSECELSTQESLRLSYQNGFKEGSSVKAPLVSIIKMTKDTRQGRRRVPSPVEIGQSCNTFHQSMRGENCFELHGTQKGICEVCVEKKSCFMALNDRSRNLCEAYKENRGCFMALNGDDRSWCEVVLENKSCSQAFFSGRNRSLCERGEIPQDHFFWSR